MVADRGRSDPSATAQIERAVEKWLREPAGRRFLLELAREMLAEKAASRGRRADDR